MGNHNTPNRKNDDSIASEFGAAFVKYLGAAVLSVLIGGVIGFALAWLFILIESLPQMLLILLAVIPAGITRFIVGERNVIGAVIGALGSFACITVIFMVLDGQNYTIGDSVTVWDDFAMYAVVSAIGGAVVAFLKGDD